MARTLYQGKYGCGSFGFSLRLLEMIVGVVEVENQLFNQDMTQILMQTHTSLKKVQEFQDRRPIHDKVYGIVTNGIWRFVECTIDGDKPTFRIRQAPFILVKLVRTGEIARGRALIPNLSS